LPVAPLASHFPMEGKKKRNYLSFPRRTNPKIKMACDAFTLIKSYYTNIDRGGVM
jgi:hypothetical protein